jgi:hypothetical protein
MVGDGTAPLRRRGARAPLRVRSPSLPLSAGRRTVEEVTGGIYAGSRFLRRADRARRNPDAPIRPYDLWRLADGAVENASARRELYRHGLIHAGLLVDAETERPYVKCPLCGETLAG